MKKILTFLLLLVSVFTVVAVSNFKPVGAANVDNSKEKWSAIGTINGTNWNKDFDLIYNATNDRYELEIALTAGNEFKIRLNKAWTTSIGYGGSTGAGISTYLSNSGGNFKVKTTGNYVLWVKDDNVRNYNDKSYGFGIDKAATVVYRTVIHYNEDGTELKNEQVIDKSSYAPAFAEKEGYRLEGWYSDKALTKKVEKGSSVTADLKLYPKYVEATDYVIYFKNASDFDSTICAYMWSDAFDGHNNADWPGIALESAGDRGYKITVDASKSFDYIIFSDGSNQTSDTKLIANNKDTFILSKNGTTYTTTVEHTGLQYTLEDAYNGGSYTKVTDILVDADAIADEVETLFHASASDLHRTTVYETGKLTMHTTEHLNKVGYKDVDGNMVRFHLDANGNEVKDFTVKNASVDSYYATLNDFIQKSLVTQYGTKSIDAEWQYENGVYYVDYNENNEVTANLIEAFRLFVSPMWIETDSQYFAFTRVSIEQTNEGLVMKLWIHGGETGKLAKDTLETWGDHALFAKAVITNN